MKENRILDGGKSLLKVCQSSRNGGKIVVLRDTTS